MKVKDLIELLNTFDQEAEVWKISGQRSFCKEIELRHLIGDDACYAEIFVEDGVKKGDYAVID